MCLCNNVKVVRTGYEQLSCLDIKQGHGCHIGAVKNKLNALLFLLYLPGSLFCLIHGINNYSRNFTPGLVSRNKVVDKVFFLCIRLVFRQTQRYPGGIHGDTMLVDFLCQAPNGHTLLPKKLKDNLKWPIVYLFSLQKVRIARIKGFNEQFWTM